MKKISLKKIAEAEMLSPRDLRSILGGYGGGSGSHHHGSGSGGSAPVNVCAPQPPLYLCGGQCVHKGSAGQCSFIPNTTTCTCGGRPL